MTDNRRPELLTKEDSSTHLSGKTSSSSRHRSGKTSSSSEKSSKDKGSRKGDKKSSDKRLKKEKSQRGSNISTSTNTSNTNTDTDGYSSESSDSSSIIFGSRSHTDLPSESSPSRPRGSNITSPQLPLPTQLQQQPTLSSASSTLPHTMSSTANSFKATSGQQVPQGLKWNTEPLTWSFDVGRLVVQPLPKTNLHNAGNGANISNACFLHQSITGDFTFSSRVGGSLVAPGDAAAVTISVSPQQWAKICLQKGKSGERRLVTVVTSPHSDEALGEILKTGNAFLRISRRGDEFVMHYAIDGKKWKLVRQFTWKGCAPELSVGVLSQSPSEVAQCMCEFADYSIVPLALSNFGQD